MLLVGVVLSAVLLVVEGISDWKEPGMLSKDQLEQVVYAAIVRSNREGPA